MKRLSLTLILSLLFIAPDLRAQLSGQPKTQILTSNPSVLGGVLKSICVSTFSAER